MDFRLDPVLEEACRDEVCNKANPFRGYYVAFLISVIIFYHLLLCSSTNKLGGGIWGKDLVRPYPPTILNRDHLESC